MNSPAFVKTFTVKEGKTVVDEICFVFQIWDLADPEGKGYLDKQVGNR